jgi:hypothetical protein
MVTRMSAERIGHFVRNIDHLPLRTDHRGLVRFEHWQDPRYVSVIEKVKKMAAEAPRALQSRIRTGSFEAQATTSVMVVITISFLLLLYWSWQSNLLLSSQ